MEERFFAKVDKTKNGCWIWNAYKNSGGYGNFGVCKGDIRYAHRVSFEIANGPIPNGMYVLHRCDNPPCVNPSHLYLGGEFENHRDAVERGRVARGFMLPHTKLSDDDVVEIRRLFFVEKLSRPQIAEKFSISREHARDIISGKRRRSTTPLEYEGKSLDGGSVYRYVMQGRGALWLVASARPYPS